MGFDIYGINPVIKEGSVEPVYPESTAYEWDDSLPTHQNEILRENFYESQRNDPELKAKRDQYFDDLAKYRKENPGVYFRSNVWFWRPIAHWLQTHIEVLDNEDLVGLLSNSGHVINNTVARIIGNTILDHDKEGLLEEWVHNNKISQALKDKEDCTLCNATGVRTDKIIMDVGLEPITKDGIEGFKCNGCNGEGVREPFDNYYTYEKQILIEFANFALNSGGFSIS
jgi:hypothetical protein